MCFHIYNIEKGMIFLLFYLGGVLGSGDLKRGVRVGFMMISFLIYFRQFVIWGVNQSSIKWNHWWIQSIKQLIVISWRSLDILQWFKVIQNLIKKLNFNLKITIQKNPFNFLNKNGFMFFCLHWINILNYILQLLSFFFGFFFCLMFKATVNLFHF